MIDTKPQRLQKNLKNFTTFNQLQHTMAAIQEFLQAANGTKPGECLGKCGKMITEEDKDHALCNSCWDTAFAKMPKVHVSFVGDNPDKLMKPPPAEIRVFYRDAPPSDVSSTSSEEEDVYVVQAAHDVFKPSPNAWVPPHRRKKAPGPAPLVRKPTVSQDSGYDLGLQCDEEFRSTGDQEEDDEEITDYCPGCESGCDADSAHRAGHQGDGYHPDCYMQEETEQWAEQWAAEIDAAAAAASKQRKSLHYRGSYDEYGHDYLALLRGLHNIQERGGDGKAEQAFLDGVCDIRGLPRFQSTSS